MSLDLIKQIKETRQELEKEKIKLRQEKNELSEKYRYNARTELFEERIIEAIEKKKICIIIYSYRKGSRTRFGIISR